MTLFVPKDFEIPAGFETPDFRVRMLAISDVVKDYDAVMTSVERLQKVFSPTGRWPRGRRGPLLGANQPRRGAGRPTLPKPAGLDRVVLAVQSRRLSRPDAELGPGGCASADLVTLGAPPPLAKGASAVSLRRRRSGRSWRPDRAPHRVRRAGSGSLTAMRWFRDPLIGDGTRPHEGDGDGRVEKEPDQSAHREPLYQRDAIASWAPASSGDQPPANSAKDRSASLALWRRARRWL
jgi:hypothetical protein